MAKVIRFLFAAFWLVMTCLLAYLVYAATASERDPGRLWAWLAFCSLTFISVTWLTYNVVFGHLRSGDHAR